MGSGNDIRGLGGGARASSDPGGFYSTNMVPCPTRPLSFPVVSTPCVPPGPVLLERGFSTCCSESQLLTAQFSELNCGHYTISVPFLPEFRFF